MTYSSPISQIEQHSLGDHQPRLLALASPKSRIGGACLLQAHGHTQLALLCRREGLGIGDSHGQGYRDALRVADITPQAEWIGCTCNSLENAYAAAAQLMSTQLYPSAISCANDVMAFGVMRYRTEADIQPG